MNDNIYDITIIGAGVAGAFALYKLADYKDLKTCIIDFGRPPNKRRKQLEGWFGCFPNSNARLYEKDIEKVKGLCGTKTVETANKLVTRLLQNNGPINKSKNKEPSESVKKRLRKNGYSLALDNYIQWKPENIHQLSREISEYVYDRSNVDLLFDTEVLDIDYINNIYVIKTENGIVKSNKILLCVGRSGWRFANKIYSKFNIFGENSSSYFGFRSELSTSYMKDWNESHCTVLKSNIKIGPMSWRGTVIPEDHDDLVISSWRSNEDRWDSDKVSFSVIFRDEYKDKGCQQTERLGKLAYVLSDSRIGKIKIKEFIATKNDLLYIPEYKWFIPQMKEIEKIIPNFIDKAYIYIPDILTYMHCVTVKKDLSTNFNNLYVAGETAGVSGIYSAALSGVIAATNISR